MVDKVSSTYGYPELVKSDNGPPFNSQAWKDFLSTCGVKHRKITPLWPQANAQAENFNKPMMKVLRAAHIQGYSWINALHQFLRVYRCTPHSTTTFTPYYLLFGREPQTKLPEISIPSHSDDKLVHLQDTLAKSLMKQHSDQRMHAQKSSLQVDDTVLVRQRKANKLSTPFDPQPLVVADKKGSMITAKRDGEATTTRNVNVSSFASCFTHWAYPAGSTRECFSHHPSEQGRETG